MIQTTSPINKPKKRQMESNPYRLVPSILCSTFLISIMATLDPGLEPVPNLI
jgi:hypothetical protein